MQLWITQKWKVILFCSNAKIVFIYYYYAVLSDTVELIKMWFIETLGEDSDELQDMLDFIDTGKNIK